MDYAKDTRDAYRNETKAHAYHGQYTRGAKWARFTMWRQRVIIERIIRDCHFTRDDRILDIPCGTGVVGRILCASAASVIASDISTEMMRYAVDEYAGPNFGGFVQADITRTPFPPGTFDCVVLLAFMHRLPKDIRLRTWTEVVGLSRRFVLVNYSVDSLLQRTKQRLLRLVRPGYVPAPSPLSLQEIVQEIRSQGLVIRKLVYIAPFLSAKVVFLTSKDDGSRRASGV